MRCSSSVGVVPVFSFRGSSGQTRLAGKSLYWISQQENHLQTEVFCMLWLKTKHVFFSTWTVQSFVVQYAAIQQLIHDVVLRCRSSSKSLQYSSKRCLWRVDGCDSLQNGIPEMILLQDLVGGFNLHLRKIWVSWDDDIFNIWKVIIHSCSKPPTRYISITIITVTHY